jgi:hypothetical protein
MLSDDVQPTRLVAGRCAWRNLHALPAMLLVCVLACRGSGPGEGTGTALPAQPIAAEGCLTVDEARGRLLLSISEPPRESTPDRDVVGSGGSHAIDQSTSIDGPWIGTRRLELSAAPTIAITQYDGRRIRVIGALEEQIGTTGRTDQIQHATGVRLRRLRVATVEPLAGDCAPTLAR